MTDDVRPVPKATDPVLDDRLLERYVAGECTLPERVAVDRWVVSNPDWGHALMAMQHEGLLARQGHREPFDDTGEIEHLMQLVESREIRQGGKDIRTRGALSRFSLRHLVPSSWTPHAFVYGAFVSTVLLFLAAIPFLRSPRFVTPGSPLVSVYTTGNGQRSTVTLPDGSTVLLNVGSRLEVPVDYHLNNRALRLDGEAYFTVTPDPHAPFTVTSGTSTTRVLGTRFVIRHYETDTTTTVVVRDGKVAVGTVVLTAAQRAVVSGTRNSVITTSDGSEFSFSQGVLRFNMISLPAAILDLNRWYNVDIKLGDPELAYQQIDGGFKEGSVSDLISILELMYGIRVVREGQVLTLFPRG